MPKQALTLLTCLLLALAAAGCAPERHCAESPVCSSAYVRTELYFGLSKPDGTHVSAAEWQKFLDERITPEFPDGLTVVDAHGQWRDSAGKIAAEGTKVLIVIHRAGAAADAAFERIIAAYKAQFHQESVLRCSVAAMQTNLER